MLQEAMIWSFGRAGSSPHPHDATEYATMNLAGMLVWSSQPATCGIGKDTRIPAVLALDQCGREALMLVLKKIKCTCLTLRGLLAC